MTIYNLGVMLDSWHAFWHAIEPYVYTFGGSAFLVLIVRGMLKGVTAAKFGGRIYRTKEPLQFWFFAIVNLILGAALVLAGIASF
jgi:hypothetical protein